MDHEAVIGLETHVQLKTNSKMCCGCVNAFGSPSNTNISPVCVGLPGVLPVPNDEALPLTALTGLLLDCTLPPRAKLDRRSDLTPSRTAKRAVVVRAKPDRKAGLPSRVASRNVYPCRF